MLPHSKKQAFLISVLFYRWTPDAHRQPELCRLALSYFETIESQDQNHEVEDHQPHLQPAPPVAAETKHDHKMAFNKVLETIGLSSHKSNEDTDSETDTETSEEAVETSDEEDSNMAKGTKMTKLKPKAQRKALQKASEAAVATNASPSGSPQLPSAVLPLSFFAAGQIGGEEQNNSMIEVNRMTKALPEARTSDLGDVAIPTSPAGSPKPPSNFLAHSVITAEQLDDKHKSDNMVEGKGKSKAFPEAYTGGLEDAPSSTSPAGSPKLPFVAPALALAPLVDEYGDTTKKHVGEPVEDHGANHRKETHAVIGDIGDRHLGNLMLFSPADRALTEDVDPEIFGADRTTSVETQPKPKPKKKNKKNKKNAAAPVMPSSSSDDTFTGLGDANTLAAINARIAALANLTVSNPKNIDTAASASSNIATAADFSVGASTNLRTTAQTKTHITALANPTAKVHLVLKHPFGFDEYRDELKCRKPECGKLTNCYDGSTVICPRCGVNSYFRYCSLAHLLHPGMAFHWAQECGKCSIPEESLPLVDKSTLIVRPAAMRPYIACDLRDNPARHRQAVYHSSNGAAGDYFVFNDNSLRPAGLEGHVTVIGAGKVIAVVRVSPDYGMYQGHSIFQEILQDCLRRGFTRPDKCLALVDIITKELAKSGQWSQEVADCLIFQVRNEFAYEIPQKMLYIG